MNVSTAHARFRWSSLPFGASRRQALREAAKLYTRLGQLAWRVAPGLVGVLGLLHLSQALVPAVQVWLYKLLVDGVAHAGPGAPDGGTIEYAVTIYLAMLLFAQAAAALRGPLDDQLTERL